MHPESRRRGTATDEESRRFRRCARSQTGTPACRAAPRRCARGDWPPPDGAVDMGWPLELAELSFTLCIHSFTALLRVRDVASVRARILLGLGSCRGRGFPSDEQLSLCSHTYRLKPCGHRCCVFSPPSAPPPPPPPSGGGSAGIWVLRLGLAVTGAEQQPLLVV